MRRDAHKEHMATTAVELASVTKITLSAALSTATVSVYLVTMVTYVRNSAQWGRMVTSASRIVHAMKMEHGSVTIEQVGCSGIIIIIIMIIIIMIIVVVILFKEEA